MPISKLVFLRTLRLMACQIVFDWGKINKAFSKVAKIQKKAKTIPPSNRLSRGNVYGKFTLSKLKGR